MRVPIVVIKLGGSLLDLVDLTERLRRVLDHYCQFRVILVVGGGSAADLVREWDRLHNLSDETAHRLALEAMTFNARFVCNLLPDAELVGSMEDCHTVWSRVRSAVVDAATLVPDLERATGEARPHNWDVTSDSLSAWIAASVKADRLVLLKSVDCPDGESPCGGDLVDRDFLDASRRIPCLEWINLRSTGLSPCSFGMH